MALDRQYYQINAGAIPVGHAARLSKADMFMKLERFMPTCRHKTVNAQTFFTKASIRQHLQPAVPKDNRSRHRVVYLHGGRHPILQDTPGIRDAVFQGHDTSRVGQERYRYVGVEPSPVYLSLERSEYYIGPPTFHIISQVISRSAAPEEPRIAIAHERPMPEVPASCSEPNDWPSTVDQTPTSQIEPSHSSC